MNNRTFTQDLLGVQNDLLRFAYKPQIRNYAPI